MQDVKASMPQIGRCACKMPHNAELLPGKENRFPSSIGSYSESAVPSVEVFLQCNVWRKAWYLSAICRRECINQQYVEDCDLFPSQLHLARTFNYLSGLLMLRALLARLLVCESVKQGAEEKYNARGCRSAS
jgi:hypothetical protein